MENKIPYLVVPPSSNLSWRFLGAITQHHEPSEQSDLPAVPAEPRGWKRPRPQPSPRPGPAQEHPSWGCGFPPEIQRPEQTVLSAFTLTQPSPWVMGTLWLSPWSGPTRAVPRTAAQNAGAPRFGRRLSGRRSLSHRNTRFVLIQPVELREGDSAKTGVTEQGWEPRSGLPERAPGRTALLQRCPFVTSCLNNIWLNVSLCNTVCLHSLFPEGTIRSNKML